MGCFLEKELDNVTLTDVNLKKVRQAAVIRKGDYVFIHYNEPRYRNQHEFSVTKLIRTERWAFPLSVFNWHSSFLDVLVSMKIMKAKVRDGLIAARKKYDESKDREYDMQELDRIMKKYPDLGLTGTMKVEVKSGKSTSRKKGA